jgi:hypothetical protein
LIILLGKSTEVSVSTENCGGHIVEQKRIFRTPDCRRRTVKDRIKIGGIAEFVLQTLDDSASLDSMGQCFPNQQTRRNPIYWETIKLDKPITLC